MMPPRTAAPYLRAATQAAHQALDDHLHIVDRLMQPASRAQLLAGYHRLHASAEPAIAARLHADPMLDLPRRLRAPAIAALLQATGVAPDPPIALPLDGPAQALGALYVLEGSTLGGRTILRTLAARGADPRGLEFLDPHGAASGAMWRRLLQVLEHRLAHDTALLDAASQAASATFRLARLCLHPEAGRGLAPIAGAPLA